MIDNEYVRKQVERDLFPRGPEIERQIGRRRRLGTVWRWVFLGAAALAVLILSVLLLKIVGDANGYVAVESAVTESELLPQSGLDGADGATTLDDLPFDALVSLYQANVSAGRCRAVEYEQRFYDDRLVCDSEERFQTMCASDNPRPACTLPARDAASVRQLIEADVIKPTVVSTWNLWESLFRREEIFQTAATEFPDAEVYFRRWLTWDFVTSPNRATRRSPGCARPFWARCGWWASPWPSASRWASARPSIWRSMPQRAAA